MVALPVWYISQVRSGIQMLLLVYFFCIKLKEKSKTFVLVLWSLFTYKCLARLSTVYISLHGQSNRWTALLSTQSVILFGNTLTSQLQHAVIVWSVVGIIQLERLYTVYSILFYSIFFYSIYHKCLAWTLWCWDAAVCWMNWLSKWLCLNFYCWQTYSCHYI